MTQDNMAVLKAKLAGVPKSKTMWFNGLMGIFIETMLPYAVEALPRLYGILPNSIYITILFVILGGNVLIRLKTDKDLADK